jgi:hypothetical protein
MSKGKVSRFVTSVTNCWSISRIAFFHLKDDILSAEAVKCLAFTSDEFRVQLQEDSRLLERDCTEARRSPQNGGRLAGRAIPVASAMG